MILKNSPLYIEDIESVLRLKCDFSKLNKKTVLITGATGLIGSVVVDMFLLVADKFDISLTLLLISRHCDQKIEQRKSILIKSIKCDVSNCIPSEIFSEKIDFIIHLASNVHPKQYAEFPVETIKTNVFATESLLDLASRNYGCRFVLASSVEIYGNASEKCDGGFSENDFGYLDCNTERACYNESKRLCETLCQAYKSEKSVDIVIARFCRCYGPTLKKDDTKALSQFIANAVSRENIVLKSSGNQYFSYLYSADAASALIFLMLNGINGEAYNVSDKKSNIRLRELASLVAESCGLEVVFELASESEKKGYSKAETAILNPLKINCLGWIAQFEISSGIKRTIEILQGDFSG